MIRRQDTHLDRVMERLREPRVRAVLKPILAGAAILGTTEDERQLVVDLGLVRRIEGGGMRVSNPIYSEIIVRTLSVGSRDGILTSPASSRTC